MVKMTKKIALDTAIAAIKANIEGGVTEITVPYHEKDIVEVSFPMQEVLEKLVGMRDELEKRSTTPRKPTKVQEENEGYKSKVLEVLTGSGAKTVTEILAADSAFAGMTNQRMTGILTSMTDKNGGPLVRTVEKRKAYYSIK